MQNMKNHFVKVVNNYNALNLVLSKNKVGEFFMEVGKSMPLPWWEKYTLTVEEASLYFGIGEKTLRRFIKAHKDEDFIIYNGTKVQIKRKVFEKYIDDKVAEL